MKRRRHIVYKLLLFILICAAVFAAFWFGVVPQRLSPFSPLSLEKENQWFLDPKLAALRRDPALCQSILKEPHIDATPIPDSPAKNGCGWVNSVKFSEIGGARMGVEPLTCEMTAGLTLWVERELQPAALAAFDKRVTGIGDMGTYDCRNIVGNRIWKDVRSQHASANAVDVSSFTLEDGREISVLRNWKGNGPEAKFLHQVHRAACRYFRVTLGPDFNPAHANHFHFDRGLLWTCK